MEKIREINYEDLINVSAELGYQLMFSGAEIYRVEESVHRLLEAYGIEPQVFAIPNCLIISFTTPDGHPITQMRRIPPHGTDIELLEQCNQLCRTLCRSVPPLDVAHSWLKQLQQRGTYTPHIIILGQIITAGFSAAFFGGNLRDAISAAFCGLAVGCWRTYVGDRLRLNSFFQTLTGAVIVSLMALLVVNLGIGENLDAITIGTLMVLVPGMALTNAMREIMAGDIISGVSRTAEAILTAAAISLGVVVALTIGR